MTSFSAIAKALLVLGLQLNTGGDAFKVRDAVEEDHKQKLRHHEILQQNENPHCNYTNPQYIGCPCDVNYHDTCHILMPPYPTCLAGTLSQWVGYALHDGGPDCCGNNLTNCTCPIKGSEHFAMAIEYACSEIHSCTMIYQGLQATEMVRAERALMEQAMSADYPALKFKGNKPGAGMLPSLHRGTAQWRAAVVANAGADAETA